jgi:hypothetical protein
MSVPLKRNTAGQTVYVTLFDGADIVTTPTIAAGDIQVSLDGGAFNNMVTLPSETPAGGGQVQIPLDQAETNATHVGIRGIDQAGAEWDDFYYSIFTSTSTLADLATDIAGVVADIAALVVDVAAVAADVWSYATRTLTMTGSAIIAAITGSNISIHRGDSISISIADLGDISGRAKLWFCVKRDRRDTDDQAIILIEESARLTRLNGAAYGTPAHGSITVTDAVAGDITIEIDEAATAELIPSANVYDVQVLDAGAVSTLTDARCDINADITRATS